MLKQVIALVIFGSSFFLSSSWAFQSDVDAIRSQAGCFQVKFHFEETLKNSGESMPPYGDSVTEWIQITEDTAGTDGSRKISLVHILTALKGNMIMKHWRDSFTKSPSSIWEYQPLKGAYRWEKRKLNSEEYKDRWIQTIYHINDGPNRACEGTWLHDGVSKWSCSTLAPITRRDWKRTDIDHYQYRYENAYQENEFSIGGTISKFSGEQEISTEVGGGSYIRVNEEACQHAKNWWERNQKGWNDLMGTWNKIYDESSSITLKEPTLKTWKSNWKKLYKAATSSDEYVSGFATKDWSNWTSRSAWSSWARSWVRPSAWSSPKVDFQKIILEDWDIR